MAAGGAKNLSSLLLMARRSGRRATPLIGGDGIEAPWTRGRQNRRPPDKGSWGVPVPLYRYPHSKPART